MRKRQGQPSVSAGDTERMIRDGLLGDDGAVNDSRTELELEIERLERVKLELEREHSQQCLDEQNEERIEDLLLEISELEGLVGRNRE